MDSILFLIFAVIAVLCAVSMVLQSHPIASALSLVGVMVALAAIYLLLGGEFIAAAQLVVYSGAIMVLFVFVIMLLNAGAEKKPVIRSMGKYVGRSAGAWCFWDWWPPRSCACCRRRERVVFGSFRGGGPVDIGNSLFTVYVLPFEATSVLILIAILGAIVLARKEID